jgi:hypothetical protein
MPALALRREAAALLGYVCVALAFSWPLPAELATALLGSPGGDTGVYVWNLWVFRHEIVQNHRLPFLTDQILALGPSVPLALHNYTTFANVLAFPLLPILGVVASFNVLIIASSVLTAYAMYCYARVRTSDAGAAWVGGLLFGFSPFMTSRMGEHFSLVLAAPLPLFAWLMYRLYAQPTLLLSCAAGATVAWAFMCDAYYAVYCLLIALFMACYSIFSVERQSPTVRRIWPRAVVDLLIVCVGGFIAGVVISGGGQLDLLGIRFSATRLYNPMLILTLLVLTRLWLTIHPRVTRVLPISPYAQAAVPAALVCALILAPVLGASGSPFGEQQWINPEIWWRNSPPGVDVLGFFAPNPMHPWFGFVTARWLATMEGGIAENAASIPWVALVTIVGAAIVIKFRPPRGWVIFTAVMASLALGPFVHAAGQLLYIPTPWAILRYLPVIGAARMPTRITVLVFLGVSMMLVMALQHIRSRSRRPNLVVACVAALLLLELLPAPRTFYSAEVPAIYHMVAADPRPVRLTTLPFGLRDGIESRGNTSASGQFYQTVHGKRLLGGYLSRLPRRSVERYRRDPTLGVLLRLSERRALDPGMLEKGLASADETLARTNVGYVVVDRLRAPKDLQDFARQAFHLTLVAEEGSLELYRTPLAPPLR